MRILILHRLQPFPPRDGGTLRYAYLARYLAEHFPTALLCFHEPPSPADPGPEVTDAFVEFTSVPMPPFPSGPRKWLNGEPGEVQRLASSQMQQHVERVMRDFNPDVLIAGEPGMTRYLAPYADKVRILDYICVTTLQFQRLSEINTGLEKWLWAMRRWKYAKFHRQIAGIYDRCLLNSREDEEDLLASAPRWSGTRVVANGLDLDQYPLDLAPVEPHTIIYPGATNYPPNYDAVKWFAESILPQVREAVPDVKMYVTGRYPEDGTRIEAAGLEYTGFVDDVKPWISRASVCVVPLRAGGGGVRYKVLEAMALGAPMVSTAIGSEGVAYTDGENILMAEDAETFARHTIRLLQDTAYRNQVSAAARRLIEEQYDWQKLAQGITDEMQQLVSNKAARPDADVA